MYDKAIEWAKKRYPKEHRYMMRLWRASWRLAPSLTIGAAIVGIVFLTIPAAIVSFTIGRMVGTTIINNNMLAPGTPDQSTKTKVDIGPRKRETMVIAAPIPTSLRILFGPEGVSPKEMHSQNIEWKAIENIETGFSPKYPISNPIPNNDDPAWACAGRIIYDEKCWIKHSYKSLELVLSFEKPITFRDIKVLAVQGGETPKWDQVIMTDTDAILRFSSYPIDKLIDIEAIE